MIRRRALMTGLAVLLSAATLMAADVRVTPLIAEGQVFASFTAPDAYSQDVRESVQSGLATSLTFWVELRQSSLVWFDRTLASATVTAAIKYDALTGSFQVTRMADGQVQSSDRTAREEDVKKWATEFERVKLSNGDGLEPNGEYYVRVRVRATPRRNFILWPWGRDDGAGRADFTFIR
ncbi:MAG: DUF4390 domain-containing protein [Acidobacteria bacterium]|nr:MAG: DUF4390 domain-containing protein [Acidobacteriota bacterium]